MCLFSADVDECLSFNGGCEQVCVNEAEAFTCGCHSGFELRKDEPTKCQRESQTPSHTHTIHIYTH